MSVDGEIMTDVMRQAATWRCGERNTGVMVMTIAGSEGTGRSTALANFAASARPRLCRVPIGSLGAFAEDCDAVIVTAALYDLLLWSSQHAPLPTSAMVVLVIDDIVPIAQLLANMEEGHLEHIVSELSLLGGVLVTVTDEDGQLPQSVLQHSRVVMNYSLPRTLSKAACYRHLCGAGFSRDVSGAVADTSLDVPVAVLSLAARAAHVRGAVDAGSLITEVLSMMKFGDAQGDASLLTLQRLKPLDTSDVMFGVAPLLSRLEMLCRIHVARHGTPDSDASERLADYRPGRVATSSASTTGVFLHGPSGCGKTTVLRAVASKMPDVPMYVVQGSSLYAKYLGESEERLRYVFNKARASAPCVLVLEDIDVLAVSRKSADSGSTGRGGVDVMKRMLAALLCEMDGVSGNEGVLVIGTSNQPHSIDQALLRQGRLETLLFVPPLDAEAVRDMTFSYLMKSGDIDEARKCSDAAALRCSDGCTPVGLRYLFGKFVEAAEEFEDEHLSLPRWLQCMSACREQLAAPQYNPNS